MSKKHLCKAIASLVVMLMTGCSTLPSHGPSTKSILESSSNRSDISTELDTKSLPFNIVMFSGSENHPELVKQTFPEILRNGKPFQDEYKLHPDDVLSVTVWEGADEGLFASKGQRRNSFALMVTQKGFVYPPYGTKINVDGYALQDLKEELARQYTGLAFKPEVHIEQKSKREKHASILGSVSNAGRYVLPTDGMRLLTLLSQAGGHTTNAWETILILDRNTSQYRIPLTDVLGSIENNIWVKNGDTVLLEHSPRHYSVYGAIRQPGNKNIELPNPNLMDVIGEAGGLNDSKAAAQSVFIFRDVESFESHNNATAFRIDFSRSDAFLLASRFRMKRGDVVYVANAEASELNKFISTLISPFVGTANGFQSLVDK